MSIIIRFVTMSQQHSLSVNIVHHRFRDFLRSAVYLISGILQNKTPHPHPYPPKYQNNIKFMYLPTKINIILIL